MQPLLPIIIENPVVLKIVVTLQQHTAHLPCARRCCMTIAWQISELPKVIQCIGPVLFQGPQPCIANFVCAAQTMKEVQNKTCHWPWSGSAHLCEDKNVLTLHAFMQFDDAVYYWYVSSLKVEHHHLAHSEGLLAHV